MKKYKLTSHRNKSKESNLPPSIQVCNKYDYLLCIIFADGTMAFQSYDFDIKEVKYFLSIAENFDATFESLEETAQKDEVIKDQEAIIRQLETEIESLINTPVNAS